MPKPKCEFMDEGRIKEYMDWIQEIMQEDEGVSPTTALRSAVIQDEAHNGETDTRLANCPDCTRALLRALVPVKETRARYHRARSFNKAYADMLARSED